MADPTLTSVRLGQSRLLYMNANKETTYGTVLSPAVDTRLMHACGFPPLAQKPIVINDGAHASGNPSMSPRANRVIGYTLDADHTVWAEHRSMYAIVSAAMGNDTAMDADSDYVGYRLHTSALPDTPYYLPGHTFEEHHAGLSAVSDVDCRAPGCSISEVIISWAPNELVTVGYKLLGGGYIGTPGTITETAHLSAPNALLTYDKVRVSMAAVAVAGTSVWSGVPSTHFDSVAAGVFMSSSATIPTNITHLVEKGSIRILAGASPMRAGGLSGGVGAYGGPPLALVPQAFLDLTWRMDDTLHTWRRLFASQTDAAQNEYAFEIDFAGFVDGEYSRYVFPLCAMTDNPGGGSGVGMVVHDSTFEGRKDGGGLLNPAFFAAGQIHESVDLN